MTQYGFTENYDFSGCKVFNTLANQELVDHILKLDMAKEKRLGYQKYEQIGA